MDDDTTRMIETMFLQIGSLLTREACGGAYLFDVGGGQWSMDLRKPGPPVVEKIRADVAALDVDCRITVPNLQDCLALVSGGLDVPQAVMLGKLRFSGDLFFAKRIIEALRP